MPGYPTVNHGMVDHHHHTHHHHHNCAHFHPSGDEYDSVVLAEILTHLDDPLSAAPCFCDLSAGPCQCGGLAEGMQPAPHWPRF
jgi:hypothetical protein